MGDKERLMDAPRSRGPDPRWIFPTRNDVKWYRRGKIVVLEYPKNFSAFERKLQKVLGGPQVIKRPLDDIGTLLWEMADGNNSLLEIYLEEQRTFKERVEPVDRIVGGLLETMLELNLMRLEYRPREKENERKKMHTK